ncbi:MAG TPA: phosphonate C-P lyase system protein PhnG [Hyphomicrobiaceae bacterium]|jgi:alpha-D-ribose 1-methylphosphonate 5-triphosphate synthase subunit PhnG|nr:phosphonate C-P lyase system protein PhnG [Hyphomicrobiaceae bacterium]
MARAQGNGSDRVGADIARRQALMGVCARATEAELADALARLGELPSAQDLRAPETGLVMVRGRIGGAGAPFNLGEVTVTRAAVRLANGCTGVSYLLGRSHRRARLAAMLDALAQDPAIRVRLEASLMGPVMARVAAEDAGVRADVATTKVDFFTLVRGEG